MTVKLMCGSCWSQNIHEIPDTTSIQCKNCGKIFANPNSAIPLEDRCEICGSRKSSPKSKTCSMSCAGKLAHITGMNYGGFLK